MLKKRTRLWPVVCLGALSAWSAWGQTDQTTEQKVQQLEEKVRQLELKLQQLQEQLQGTTPKSMAVTSDARLEELDQKIRVVERKSELEQEATAAKAQESMVATAGQDGFTLKSADGDFRLNLGGYVQADGRFYLDNPNNLGTNTFLLRRVRPVLQGTVYKYIDFRIVPDFGAGTATIQDASMELRYFPKASLKAGKFKTPVGLEQLQADFDMVYVERGLPSNLVPNRDVGVQLSGDLVKNRLNYAIGVFNGIPDGTTGDLDTNNRKDLVARIFTTPFQTRRSDHPLRGLGFGLGATNGKQDGALPTFKTPGQVTFFSYGSTVLASGTRTRLAPQAYYYFGPFGLLAEFVRSEQTVRKGAALTNVANHSWQIAGSYFLTGEHKSYKAGAPLRAFDPAKGGWGAWEVVSRFEQLNVDPVVFSLSLADST